MTQYEVNNHSSNGNSRIRMGGFGTNLLIARCHL